MNPFGVNKVNSSEIDTLKSQVSAGKQSNNGVTKPNIELDDFFNYLDPKVVDKIMSTPEESRSRIVKDIHQYEFDINGAQNILNSLG